MRYLVMLLIGVLIIYHLSNDPVIIKDYIPLGDREFVLSEFNRAWPDEDEMFSPKIALDEKVETHVMHVDGKPAGFIMFSMLGADASEIIYLLLAEPYRGKGYSKRLMHEAMNFVKAKGAKSTILQAHHWNARAQRLYTSLGFKEYERDDKYIRYRVSL